MADISSTWKPTRPAGTDAIAASDDLIRDNWSAIEATVETEHYMSDSDTSAGIHKLGSARVHYGTASQVSTSGADDKGRLMWASDKSQLLLLKSDGTAPAAFPPIGSPVVAAQTAGKSWFISSAQTPLGSPFIVEFDTVYDSAPIVLNTRLIQDVPSTGTGFFQVVGVSTTSIRGYGIESATGGYTSQGTVLVTVMGLISSSSVS